METFSLFTQTDGVEDELFGGEGTQESGDNSLPPVNKSVNNKSIQSYMSGMFTLCFFFKISNKRKS